MRRLLVLTMLIAITAIVPATGSAAGVTGIVVGRSGNLLLITTPSGSVHAVTGHARIGARVSTGAHKLRILGMAKHARIRGVLIGRSGSSIFLDAAGHVLAVRVGRGLASAAATAPSQQPGDVVDAQVAIDTRGELAEQDVEAVGHDDGALVQATVAAVTDGSVTLSINDQQLTLSLPAGLTLPSTIVGTQVDLKLSFAKGEPTAESADDEQGDDQQGDDQQANQASSNDDTDSGSNEPATSSSSGGDTNPGASSTGNDNSSSGDSTDSDTGHGD